MCSNQYFVKQNPSYESFVRGGDFTLICVVVSTALIVLEKVQSMLTS